MRHVSPWIPACGFIMACSGADSIVSPPPPPPPSPPPAPTFILFGIVEDSAGIRLPFAVATLENPPRTATSNDSGFFSFSGVRGPVTITVSKYGYFTQVRSLVVTTDVALTWKLARVPLSESEIVLGTTIQSTVEASSPPCDPQGWDAAAPCRRFAFTPPTSGTLSLLVTWIGWPPLDATMVTSADGRYIAFSKEEGVVEGAERISMSALVEAGQAYEIRVNSYYGQQVFQLRADLVPPP